jgi:hypothetical protein
MWMRCDSFETYPDSSTTRLGLVIAASPSKLQYYANGGVRWPKLSFDFGNKTMSDSRLRQIESALDDARSYVADIEDETPPTAWQLDLKKIHKLCNDAIEAVHRLQNTPVGDKGA